MLSAEKFLISILNDAHGVRLNPRSFSDSPQKNPILSDPKQLMLSVISVALDALTDESKFVIAIPWNELRTAYPTWVFR